MTDLDLVYDTLSSGCVAVHVHTFWLNCLSVGNVTLDIESVPVLLFCGDRLTQSHVIIDSGDPPGCVQVIVISGSDSYNGPLYPFICSCWFGSGLTD